MSTMLEKILNDLNEIGPSTSQKTFDLDSPPINYTKPLKSPKTLDFEKINDNRTTCRLINLHIKGFYDNLYIPFDFFKEDDWKINKILYNNEDVLYYNKKYVTPYDEKRFYEVFDKFIIMIEDILTPNNKLCSFLKRWTNMDQSKWRIINTKSFLKSLLNNRKFRFISPAYITNIYCDLNNKYKNDNEKIKSEIIAHLMDIYKKCKMEIKNFEEIYEEIITAYVYEYPIDTSEESAHVSAFINSIVLEILNFSEKLIDLHIYAIHQIINEIIDYYTPLDTINTYKPHEFGKRKICVV